MAIFLPQRWNRQPPYVIAADRNNPLARGLTYLSTANSRFNAATGGFETRTFAFPTVVSKVGVAVDPTSTTDRYIVAWPTNTQNFAILSVIVPQSVTGFQQIACCDTNLTRVFQFRASDAECQFIRFDTVGIDATNRVVVSVPGAFAIGKPVCVIANTRGNTASIWIDGKTAVGTIPNTPATWSIADETQSRWFERRAQVIAPNFTTETHGTQHSVLRAIFNRGLSDSEALELSNNPWQLFRPAANQTFYSLPSQGTAYSLSLDAGSYALTGRNVDLTSARSLGLDAGSYALTGRDVTLVYSAGTVSYTLSLDAGSYALTGRDVGTSFGRSLALDAGSYALTGRDVNFNVTLNMLLDSGAYNLTGQIVGLTWSGETPVEITDRIITLRSLTERWRM